MITWITGNSGAGKTTLAKKMSGDGEYADYIILDGDDMRKVWKLGLDKKDRWEQNLRVARLAKILEDQGFAIIVATICPYRKLRDEVRAITNCTFIYLKGGKKPSKEYPYEYEEEKTGLFVGRFQPFHKGHESCIRKILEKHDVCVVAVRDTKIGKQNPFTYKQRKEMIKKVFTDKRVKVIKTPDINVLYFGRDVGYGIIRLDSTMEGISATDIRDEHQQKSSYE